MKNIFDTTDVQEIKNRINALSSETTPEWGKMTVDQMLAHLNVAYDMAYTDQYKKPGAIGKLMLKLFVKKAVVGPKPYPKNGRTAPDFIIKERKNFEEEKAKLINYLDKTQSLGKAHFENRESHSFGPLTSSEWNVLFSKHLDHHLTQFGV